MVINIFSDYRGIVIIGEWWLKKLIRPKCTTNSTFFSALHARTHTPTHTHTRTHTTHTHTHTSTHTTHTRTHTRTHTTGEQEEAEAEEAPRRFLPQSAASLEHKMLYLKYALKRFETVEHPFGMCWFVGPRVFQLECVALFQLECCAVFQLECAPFKKRVDL